MVMTVRPRALIFGFKSEAVRQEYLVEPTAPSNYGAEAAAKYIAKIKEQRLRESASIPIVATLTDVVICDQDLVELGRFSSTVSAEVAGAFFNWCQLNLPSENWYGVGAAVPMFGFRIHDMLQIAALECLAAHPNVMVPFHLWHSATYIHDVFEYLVPSETRKLVGLAGLVRFLIGEVINEQALYENPYSQTVLAKKLLDRVHLLDKPSPRPTG